MPRTSENNEQVPATWREYLELYTELGEGHENAAVEFIETEARRAKHGLDDLVQTPDFQLRQLLMPMLKQPRNAPRAEDFQL